MNTKDGSGMRITTFAGGDAGSWRVESMRAVAGSVLPRADRLQILETANSQAANSSWILRGASSYERYVHRPEREVLVARQPPLGRPQAICAALIPIRKSCAWWELPQDERRAIFEERSGHIATGIRYLPGIARRLYQSRDLGEPFDFLTWFEYASADAAAFDELVHAIRGTEEWSYVDWEVDIRLSRETLFE